jgi:hypothetical protein
MLPPRVKQRVCARSTSGDVRGRTLSPRAMIRAPLSMRCAAHEMCGP